MKKRWAVRALAGLAALLCAGAGFVRAQLPDCLTVAPGQPVEVAGMPYLAPLQSGGAVHEAARSADSASRTMALFGVLPVKKIRVRWEETRLVTVCGTPFGIKMFADGAMVVGFSDIYTAEGWRNPGKEAGLRMGDVLLEMDGAEMRSNDEVQKAVAGAGGKSIRVKYYRDGKKLQTSLCPVKHADSGEWKAGVWVRDSSAGIGTLTFIDQEKGVYAGLGHPISDADTGESVLLRSGEVVPVEITGVQKGSSGSPGGLKGTFSGQAMGDIIVNGESGVYGHADAAVDGLLMPVARVQQVEKGKAYILTTIGTGGPHVYEAEIERARMNGAEPNRDLVIRITDPALLEATGGIVQGMSGSPIIQNGRLVGAVTHVLVNDPTRGFGIFAQSMLDKADEVARG